jgi:hypothetical protein
MPARWYKYIGLTMVDGRPEPLVKVYVYEPGTQNEITVYEDRGYTEITQPILTDAAGMFSFFVDADAHPSIKLYFEKEGVDFTNTNSHHEEIVIAW